MKTTRIMNIVLIAGMFFSTGCSMLRLKKELKVLDKVQEISGKVVSVSAVEDPVVVVLWGLSDSDRSAYWVTRCDVEFSFLRDSGKYYLMAFADTNEDGRYQETEAAGIYNEGKALDLSFGEKLQGLEVKLLPPGQITLPPEVRLARNSGANEKFAFRPGKIGELTTMDNPLFSDESGALGLWTPLQFLEEIGFRVYFLEAFDPNKIPVLFVHGAAGHPGTWQPMVETLDREKYQPWLAFYPSGLRLDELAEAYALYLGELQVTYDFKQIYVVAHSMGGLVSRSMILNYAEQKERAQVPVFISLSSPWAGHTGARAGVDHAPAVVPSWYDMVPGCQFQQTISTQPMPPEMKHYLFFSFQGKANLMPGHVNNDGAVTLTSQLSMPIQQQTERIIGIDASHVGILSDTNTLNVLSELF